MSKKQLIQQIIDTFEQNAPPLPDSLKSKFSTIRRNIAAMPDDQFELKTNLVVTAAADKQPYDPDHTMYVLEEAYSEMEPIARNAYENQDALHSVIEQLRGLLDTPERYFP